MRSNKPYALEVAIYDNTMFAKNKKRRYWSWKNYRTLKGVLDAYNFYKKNPIRSKYKNGTSKYWRTMTYKFRIVHNCIE